MINDIISRITAAFARWRYSRAGFHFDSEHWRRELCALPGDDIDHIVPLAEAWRAGADTWPAYRRAEFANNSANLWPIPRRLNREKSDYTLGDMPAHVLAEFTPAQQQTIAAQSLAMKQRYDLAFAPGERGAIHNILRARAGETRAPQSRCPKETS